MAFCPICKTNHDPDLLCTQKAQQAIRDSGKKEICEKVNKTAFRETVKKANICIFLILLVLVVIALAAMLVHGY